MKKRQKQIRSPQKLNRVRETLRYDMDRLCWELKAVRFDNILDFIDTPRGHGRLETYAIYDSERIAKLMARRIASDFELFLVKRHAFFERNWPDKDHGPIPHLVSGWMGRSYTLNPPTSEIELPVISISEHRFNYLGSKPDTRYDGLRWTPNRIYLKGFDTDERKARTAFLRRVRRKLTRQTRQHPCWLQQLS